MTSPITGLGFKIPEYILATDTHNAFIQIAAEMGIFGILVFVWFLWRVFRHASALLNTEFAVIGIGFMGCLVSFIVVNVFYSNFFRDTVVGTFWIMLGILAASKSFLVKKNKKSPKAT
ncbi:O-antigen ligase family protein [Candidatus Omnitrophota bacterium]